MILAAIVAVVLLVCVLFFFACWLVFLYHFNIFDVGLIDMLSRIHLCQLGLSFETQSVGIFMLLHGRVVIVIASSDGDNGFAVYSLQTSRQFDWRYWWLSNFQSTMFNCWAVAVQATTYSFTVYRCHWDNLLMILYPVQKYISTKLHSICFALYLENVASFSSSFHCVVLENKLLNKV